MVEVFGLDGEGDRIERVYLEMAELVREHEPGCIRYDVGRSRDEPDTFLIWEIYVDQHAFEQHRVTPHFETLMNRTLPALIHGRKRTLHEIIT